MKVFDTNMIIRYLVGDIPEQAQQVLEILKTEKVVVLPEVIAEVVYIMKNFYGCDRKLTSNIISGFLSLDAVQAEHSAGLLKGLEFYRTTSLDFVDCLLVGLYIAEDYEICTFDKKLNRLMKRLDAESGDSD
jgi:predicted nucleic-acid-binding protein